MRNSSLLINLAKAIGRIVVSYKDIQNLAGYTTLIYELQEVLTDLESGHYKRIQVKNNALNQIEEDKEDEDGSPEYKARKIKKEMERNAQLVDNSLKNRGEVIINDTIVFDSVPILSPNGDTLIQSMSFEIKPGMHLMISGPNGCGKSSLFRILGELWPVFGGRLQKRNIEKIFYIPQRPYLPNGSLRDQIIYPHSTTDMRIKRKTNDEVIVYS